MESGAGGSRSGRAVRRGGPDRGGDRVRSARGAAGRVLSRPAADETPAALLRGIGKSFRPERPALRDVDLCVAPGEIHALLGENGAGKSTLMNVLVGLVRPDAGSLAVAGEPIPWDGYGPAAAARRGIGMLHQHSALVPALTVAENLCFGGSARGFWFRPRAARRAVAALAERYGLDVPLERRAEDLSVGERQRAEILRALERGARLIVLDEPTAVLTPGETERLFDVLRRLRAAGRALVFISHKLDEVEALADRVTVLRRGEVAAVLETREVEARTLGRLMLGRELPQWRRDATHAPEDVAGRSGEPALALEGVDAPGLSEAGRLRGIELCVRPGEIVGVVGIDGNGQRELEELLAGVRAPSRGRLRVRGRVVPPDPRALRDAGLVHLSGERESAGLIRGFTLAENFVLKGSFDDRRFFRGGWLDAASARVATRQAIDAFGIVPPDPDADIATLSGGNAQKLAVARELDAAPPVLVAFNPTRGLDVGSARSVHEALLARRRQGGAVLLVSTELDEVLALADRVVALVRGRIAAVPPGSDRAAIGALLLGAEAA